MSKISQVDIHQVKEWLDGNEASVLDIRDSESFAMGHIPQACHVSNDNVKSVMNSLDKGKTLVICCYHGISSQGAAGYFMQNGFQDVHSMIGGFEAWSHSSYPSEQGPADSTS